MGGAGRRRLHRQSATRQKGDRGAAEATGANPTDRGTCGSKRHLLTDGRGVPLALVRSGATRTDMKTREDLLDVRLLEAPAEVAEQLCLDRGYDYPACRATAVAHGYTPHIPPKASAAQPLPPPGHPDRHPPRRRVVEARHRWFNRFRRRLIRWDKKAAHYLAFAQLVACLIIYRKVRHARLLSG
jgi:putative transposase